MERLFSQVSIHSVKQYGVKFEMMTTRANRSHLRTSILILAAFILALPVAQAQDAPATQAPPQQQTKPDQAPDSGGPQTDSGSIIIRKKQESQEPPPPPAPAEPKVKNPNNETFSLRVDVPIVNLDVNVILDKTHQFVPGLTADNFLVTEDGVEQHVT